MKSFLFISLLALAPVTWSQSESNPEVEIRAVIDQLFEGMRLGDSSLVRAVFHEDARGYTSYKKDDVYQLHAGSIDEFVEAVGSPHDKIWDEQISNVVIQVDDGLAHVWMDYSFYVGDEFSHKGINSMQLAHVEGKWQIIQIADTRRRK